MRTTRQARRRARRLYRACVADGLLDGARVRQVAARLVEARRRDSLAVLVEFRRLVRLDRARHTARVQSAVVLPADVKAQVEADLAREYGPGLYVSFDEDPALIGGMRVAVGSDVYDGSVRAALAAMERSLGPGTVGPSGEVTHG